MHTTEQLNTALAGRYVIDRLVGEGGMATVYLARDVKHNRKVALKVLKPDLGAVVGPDRFLAEIEVTANLQHPNLLPLFDSGAADGLLFYVMPYVEGESLRARLEREKQLPVEDAVRIAVAVASALDYAHRQGVIHRDLKPENILLHEGQPLVADFGIALAVSNAGGNRITQTGLSLGTPQYMSPEQATGDRAIDARTDIYSLGAVTYEMLTGEPPHVGSTSQAIIARVLTEKPRAIRASRPSVPVQVEGAVERALEKLPADRWATAKEFSEALTGARPVTMPAHAGAPATAGDAIQTGAGKRRVRGREVVAWVLAAGGIAAAAFLATRHPPAPVPGRFAVELPESVTVAVSGNAVALSRDGAQLAIVCVKNGVRAICVRRMDDPVAQVVRGTEGAVSPGFSPDGRWLTFVAGGSLRKVQVVGGTPQMLSDSASGASSWGDGGDVVYTSPNGSLWIVSSDGGNRRLLAKSEGVHASRYMDPDVLPGGQYALVTIWPRTNLIDSARLGVISLRDGTVKDLRVRGASSRYVAPGRIVFARIGGLVFSAPFSLRKRAVTGSAVLLIEHVMQSGGAAYSVSQNGTIAYNAGGLEGLQAMYVVDRQGEERQLRGPLQQFKEPRVSPDGRHIVVRIGTGATDGGLWIYDIAASTLTRLTADSESIRGEWTRDGSRVVYVDHATSVPELVMSRPWDGSGAPRELARGGAFSFYQIAVGPATGLSAVRRGGTGVENEILLAPTESLSAVHPFIGGSAIKTAPRVSPKGRLLAYASNESGRNEIYLRQIPGPGPVVQVSVDGGSEPVWSSDESALFYRGPQRLMVATVVERPSLAVSRRDSLFVDTYRRYFQNSAYDVFPNGREFLMTRGPLSTGAQLYVIVNWMQLIGKQAGTEGER